MAHALAAARAGNAACIDSVGLEAGTLDPFSVAVMAEIGIDISGHVPRESDALGDARFDLIIALTPAARTRARDIAAASGAAVAFWPIADPTLGEGSREQRLAAYRAVRDDLAVRIAAIFPASAES